jgi:hypothetical protein
MNIKKILSKILGLKPEMVIHHIPKRLNDKELLYGLALEDSNPTYLAILEMIERAVEDVRVEAKIGVDQRGKLTANLGAQWALEELRDSLIQYRRFAVLEMQRQQSMAVYNDA